MAADTDPFKLRRGARRLASVWGKWDIAEKTMPLRLPGGKLPKHLYTGVCYGTGEMFSAKGGFAIITAVTLAEMSKV